MQEHQFEGESAAYESKVEGVLENQTEVSENQTEVSENQTEECLQHEPAEESSEQEVTEEAKEEVTELVTEEGNSVDTVTDDSALAAEQWAQAQMEQMNSDDLAAMKFFVGGIHPEARDEDVWNHFATFGKVKDVQVLKDHSTGRNRGFGFVTMADNSGKLAVFAHQADHTIRNKRVDVRSMQPEGHSNLGRKIFVGGINPSLDEGVLDKYFTKYGTLEKTTIMRDLEGKSRGFGFVVYQDEEAAKRVLSERIHHLTATDRVEVRRAEARSKTFRTARGGAGSYNMYMPPPPAAGMGRRDGAHGAMPFGPNRMSWGYSSPTGGYMPAQNNVFDGRGAPAPHMGYYGEQYPEWGPYGMYPPPPNMMFDWGAPGGGGGDQQGMPGGVPQFGPSVIPGGYGVQSGDPTGSAAASSFYPTAGSGAVGGGYYRQPEGASSWTGRGRGAVGKPADARTLVGGEQHFAADSGAIDRFSSLSAARSHRASPY
eukprot:Lankesteria_metandrocarpae@DN3070_c0_g1_i3.p1